MHSGVYDMNKFNGIKNYINVNAIHNLNFQ